MSPGNVTFSSMLQSGKALGDAIKPSFSSPQLALYRFITSGGHQSTSRARSKRLLFHRPLPESKHNDIYKRSSKPVPRRIPTHLPTRPSQIMSFSESEIRIDPANFAPPPPSPSNVEQPHPPKEKRSSPAPPSPSSKATKPSHSRKDEQSAPLKLLKPYDLAQEVHQLCGQGDIEGAIDRLKSTPRDAQNTSVWNTMISHCVKANKYSRSYEIFNEVSIIEARVNATLNQTVYR